MWNLAPPCYSYLAFFCIIHNLVFLRLLHHIDFIREQKELQTGRGITFHRGKTPIVQKRKHMYTQDK